MWPSRSGPAASRPWPTCCTSPISARRYEADGGLSFRGFVTALGEAADAGRGARGADPRRRQRRRAPDDRPQGQGARVPGRGAGRPDLQAVARHRRSSPRCVARSVRRAAGRMGAGRSARPRAARGRARSSRGPSSRLCRRHARARPAGRARRRRRAVHRRVGESAQRGHLPEPRSPARSRDRRGVAAVQTRQRARTAQRRPGARRDRAAWLCTGSARAPTSRTASSGGTPRSSRSTSARRWACGTRT